MEQKNEDRIRAIIAATGTHGIAADAIFDEISGIIDEERMSARQDDIFDGQESREVY